MSKTKKSQSVGYVGVMHGGAMKQGWTYLLSVDVGDDINDACTKLVSYYGLGVKCRYIETTDPADVVEKLLANEEFKKNRKGDANIFEINISNCISVIKNVSKVKTAHMWSSVDDEILEPEADESKAKPAKKAAPKKAASKKEEEEEEEEAEEAEVKPAKKPAPKKAAPKKEADEVPEEETKEEAEEEEDTKPVKKVAPKKTASKKEDDEEEAEVKPAKKTAPKKVAHKKEEEEEEVEEEEDTKPAKKAAPKKAPVAKK